MADIEQQDNSTNYQVIIVECCQNCQSHQSFSRHSEWKYFEQFNQLKRKLERFVNNAIVVKNPIPDQLVKPAQARLPPNTYMNKQNDQIVTFPRIGAFQIYIYNVLIYSKLLTNNWPNHYKLIQILTKIIDAKKKGLSLDEFSVFRQSLSEEQKVEKPEKIQKLEKLQKQKQLINKPAISKKKKKDYRVYKSKDKSILNQTTPVKKLTNLDPISSNQKKQGRRTLLQKDKQIYQNSAGKQQKTQKRLKLPSLRNTISFKDQQQQQQQNRQHTKKNSNLRYSNNMPEQKQQSLKKIFNSIQQFQKSSSPSLLKRKQSSVDDNNFNSLMLERNQSLQMNQMKDNKEQQQDEQMKMLQDKSVQYSQLQPTKDMMNRSIQYQQDQGFHCDYGLQIDDGSLPKQKNSHFVQTQKIQFLSQYNPPPKPYMLDQQVTANIELPKNQTQNFTQTITKQYHQQQTNTQMKAVVNRGYQFPQQQVKPVPKQQFNVIDNSFTHLFEKRRNIVDSGCYSVDKFEEKATKYKWIGRANQKISIQQIRRNFLHECLVFCFYNYFGIKTPQKRLSFQSCSNVIIDQKTSKLSTTTLVHIMTIDNPQIQYFNQFEQYDDEQMKYPLSEQLTFKNSKQKIKFTNYGGFLALAYFIQDKQIYEKQKNSIGVVISNQQVKQIYKINAQGYVIPENNHFIKSKICVQKKIQQNHQGTISLQRTTQQIQLQFIAMLTKIIDTQVFTQLLKYFQQTFIHLSPSHKVFRNSLLSMKTQKVDQQTVNSFLQMLRSRRQLILNNYKGQIYSYIKYRTLQPKLAFNLQNFIPKKVQNKQITQIDRRFVYNDKIVSSSQVQKHIRNKDNFVIIYGQSGIGKTTFIEQISRNLDLKYGDKLRIKYITKQILIDQAILKKKCDQIIDQYRKQIIIIDDAQLYIMQIIMFLQKIYIKQDTRTKPQISFCLATTSQVTKLKLRLNAIGIQIIHCTMMALQIEEIRNYMMKTINLHNYTDKKTFIQQVLGVQNTTFTDYHPKYQYIKLLRNPLYLQIYCTYLTQKQSISDPYTCLLHTFNRYSLLKQVYSLCWNFHIKQCKQTSTQFQDCLHQIRKIAFQYYINNYKITENIKEIIHKYTNNSSIIANQLAFYPINLQAIVKKDKQLFIHREYLYYFIAEAYCFYLEKSYRNMSMNKLYSNWELLSLVKQRYSIQKTYSKLLDVVQKSRKYKSTWEQSSNAITLLNKIDFTFSNFNFDEVQIPQADLTQSIFYNCTFRGTNMLNIVFYKAQLINCLVDNAVLDNVGLYQKKYQSQYTVLTAALSMDGRNIAMGCGNYLMIIQADTGKQLKKIQAHMDIIRSVKYSKDNNTLISIADDKTLRMWDTRSYRSVVFKLPQKGTIAFSSQTDMIASVTKSSLKVWNIKSMANQFTLQGHGDLITCLEFSTDGNNIVTGSRDTTIKIWSTKKGQLIKTFKGHSAQIINLKISPLKKTIVSSSKDKDIIIWGFDTVAQISKKKFPDQITQICLDEKQKFVAIALSKQSYIAVLHVQTLEIVYTLQGHKSRIVSLNFDITYRKLISLGRDKTVKIWDFDKITQVQQKRYIQQKKKNLKITKGPILSIAYDKINQKYVTAHENGQINIFSVIQNRHVDQLISHNGPVNCLQFDKAGKMYSAGSDGSVKVWNLSVKRQPKVYDLHSSSVLQLKLNQRNRIIATSSTDFDLVIVDYTGIKIILSTKQQGRVESIEFNKDEKIMAVGGSQKYIAIYNVGQGGNSINRMEELGPNSDVVTCMVFHGDAYLVAALKNGHIAIWNHLRSTLSRKIENSTLVTSLLSFQKKYVCFSSDDGKLRVVDMDEGKQVKVFRMHQKCTCICINNNQSLLYQATQTGNLVIWDLRSLKQRKDKVEFDRIAFDEQGLKVVQIQGLRDLLIRDLHYHEQQMIKVKQINSDIEGVTFYKGKIILLLKNGIHWELGKKQFVFGGQQQIQGDLFWIKNKKSSIFFKTPVRKLKGIKKPIQAVLEDLSY